MRNAANAVLRMRKPGGAALPFIFPLGRQSAADMPLLLVFLDDFTDLCSKSCMQQRQPHCDILMDGGFGDSEDGCGAADGCGMLCDIGTEAQCAVIKRIRRSVL